MLSFDTRISPLPYGHRIYFVAAAAATAATAIGYFAGHLFSSPPDRNLRHEQSRLTLSGLPNAGNLCFLNSILQALAACPAVLAFLLTAKPAKGTVSGRDGMLVALSDVLAALTPPSDGPTAVSGASTNKAVLRALGPSTALRDGAQQDAGEALEELCNAAVEESTAIFTRDRLPALRVVGAAREILDEGDDASRRCATDELLREWRRYASCPLQGVMAQMLSCLACGHRSVTQLHPSLLLRLTLPSQADQVIPGTSLRRCLADAAAPELLSDVICSECSHKATLLELQRLQRDSSGFTEEESFGYERKRVAADRLTACAGCVEECECEGRAAAAGVSWRSVRRSAAKRTAFARPPPVLCLELRRAHMLPTGQSVKLSGHVAFPLLLDLSTYCSQGLSVSSLRNAASGGAASSRPLPYRLAAVVVHHGGPTSGHYATYRRYCATTAAEGADVWLRASDERVRAASEEEVLSSEAVLLFYSRHDTAGAG